MIYIWFYTFLFPSTNFKNICKGLIELVKLIWMYKLYLSGNEGFIGKISKIFWREGITNWHLSKFHSRLDQPIFFINQRSYQFVPSSSIFPSWWPDDRERRGRKSFIFQPWFLAQTREETCLLHKLLNQAWRGALEEELSWASWWLSS